MVEPNLHGYYQIEEERFLVKRGEEENRTRLLFYKFIYEGVSNATASLRVPDSLKYLPSLVLDRRGYEARDAMPKGAIPIHVYNELLFKHRVAIYFKGMRDIFRISHEYVEESGDEKVEICTDAFPLKSYSGLKHCFNNFMDADHNSFLNTMFLRYVFRIELAIAIQNQLKVGRGEKNVNLRVHCTPDQVSQIFSHVDVKPNIRRAIHAFASFVATFNLLLRSAMVLFLYARAFSALLLRAINFLCSTL